MRHDELRGVDVESPGQRAAGDVSALTPRQSRISTASASGTARMPASRCSVPATWWPSRPATRLACSSACLRTGDDAKALVRARLARPGQPGEHVLARDPEVREHVRREPVTGREQPQQRVLCTHVVVTQLPRLLAGVVKRPVRDGRPAPAPGARLGRRRAVALLGGLLARAEQLANLRPREAGAPSVGDEALQQRVAGLAELAAELNRRTQSISGRRGHARLDDRDELIDANEWTHLHASTLG